MKTRVKFKNVFFSKNKTVSFFLIKKQTYKKKMKKKYLSKSTFILIFWFLYFENIDFSPQKQKQPILQNFLLKYIVFLKYISDNFFFKNIFFYLL
ncbi:hypothetical protein CMESO_217 (nucleomorph) [Chroomonas mesostigmatica CCMP1168]|uniref:Uncharacterized protein n=1 Tax=Chroomonas mesostigmatica CCMP1168 TaxID=1195612 RepID=J7GA81_9CRYP|nr:hypothetical protein CMESO_217 [Chroomonas mesostigmatica CCMP1168]